GMLDFPFPTVLFLVLAVILGLAMAGLHPVIVFVAIGQVIPPEVLGLSPALFGSALLAMWGIGAAASPFSGVSLYLSRIAGVPSWRVAWIWNGPYVMAATLIVAVIVIMARLLGID
ncbi:MAG: hypothetical protein MI741_02265, partial [Rhodospirillales bacterium]|nr:hypothetical protein [Rhodospirillales bacterium]